MLCLKYLFQINFCHWESNDFFVFNKFEAALTCISHSNKFFLSPRLFRLSINQVETYHPISSEFYIYIHDTTQEEPYYIYLFTIFPFLIMMSLWCCRLTLDWRVFTPTRSTPYPFDCWSRLHEGENDSTVFLRFYPNDFDEKIWTVNGFLLTPNIMILNINKI